MRILNRLSLQSKLVWSLLLMGMLPLVILSWITVDASRRLEEREAATLGFSIRGRVVLVLGVAAFGLLPAAWWLGRSISRPVLARLRTMEEVGLQVAGAAGQISATSQSLAEGAGEQAASLEQTCASLEEMSSMTRRNAEHAGQANEVANLTRLSQPKGVFANFGEETFKFLRNSTVSSRFLRLVQTYPLFGTAGRLIPWVPFSYGEAFFALSSSIQEREGSLLLVDRREGKGGWR